MLRYYFLAGFVGLFCSKSKVIYAALCKFRSRRARARYSAVQNEQWCLEANSVSTCGCGGTSNITRELLTGYSAFFVLALYPRGHSQ